MRAMDKVEAIYVLIQDSRNPRLSPTSARRVMRACRGLGLTEAEAVRVLCELDYCEPSGKPHRAEWADIWPLIEQEAAPKVVA